MRRYRPAEVDPISDWWGNLAEAHLLAGRREEAIEDVNAIERWAEKNDHSIGRAAAARGRLLLAEPDELDRRHEDAIAWYDDVPMPFEQARCDLYYGERLRRAKRVTDARSQLFRALGAFEELGARPWGSRAGPERTKEPASGGRIAHE